MTEVIESMERTDGTGTGTPPSAPLAVMNNLKQCFADYATYTRELTDYFSNFSMLESISNWDNIEKYLESGISKSHDTFTIDGVVRYVTAYRNNSTKPDLLEYSLEAAKDDSKRPLNLTKKTEKFLSKVKELNPNEVPID